MNDKFEQARRCINRGLIERYLQAPGAYWKAGEYWTLNTNRGDKHIGSFHINEEGQWFDHAVNEGGDLIDYISMRHNISKSEAAEKIIEDSGGTVDQPKQKTEKKTKPGAVIPIPPEAFEKLNTKLKSKWSVDKHGECVDGWKWKDKSGCWCCTARHERDGKKDVLPYYYATDGKWHEGNPVPEHRPVYRADELPGTDVRILIVEGEKCASVEVNGYFAVTWIGGTGQVRKTDWKALSGYADITIWPDNDAPGIKAAMYIKDELPQAKVLKIQGKPDKWDIANAKAEGLDLIKFIEGCGYVQHNKNQISPDDGGVSQHERSAPGGQADRRSGKADEARAEAPGPFVHLGYDDNKHYFLTRGSQTVKKITHGSFNKIKLLELAPLSWWCMEYHDKRGFDVDVAIDTTIRDSERVGFFIPSRIRGTGVWMHDDQLIVNNGDYTADDQGNPVVPSPKFHYVKSEKRMGEYAGDMATIEQGGQLVKLFLVQGFENSAEAMQLLGWVLIAPFGGVLKWRPHIWITGPAQSGKSFILENIVEPLIRPFYEKGTGKTSAPGIYRAIRNTACPIILDEMEPGRNANKETIQKIEEKLELARNASSDFSSEFTLTSMNGSGLTEKFCVRSCFCFASILPYFTGEAIESRVLISRIKNINFTRSKIEKTQGIMDTGILNDPMIFQRRIFRNLKTIIANIDVCKKILISELKDQRKADNLAPIFSALVSLVADPEKIAKDRIEKFMSEFIPDLKKERSHSESDEDKLMYEILDHTIMINPGERYSAAELITKAADISGSISPDHDSALQRQGLRIIKIGDTRCLAIASSHSAIKKILSETMYAGNYFEVLKRHDAKRELKTVKFAQQAKRAVLLDWEKIQLRYFTERQDEDDEKDFTDQVSEIF
ncbi:MAG: hypothetical protein KA369_08460 [Spirochaetes bacterium]|nr:hypothetical protein [Spirochaetota bacterium]